MVISEPTNPFLRISTKSFDRSKFLARSLCKLLSKAALLKKEFSQRSIFVARQSLCFLPLPFFYETKARFYSPFGDCQSFNNNTWPSNLVSYCTISMRPPIKVGEPSRWISELFMGIDLTWGTGMQHLVPAGFIPYCVCGAGISQMSSPLREKVFPTCSKCEISFTNDFQPIHWDGVD